MPSNRGRNSSLTASNAPETPGLVLSTNALRNNPGNKSDTYQNLSTGSHGHQPLSESGTPELVLDVYRYRHLLRNLSSLYEKRKREEKKFAPKVNGARIAAVLARLWATQDLGLPAVSQKVLGADLGLSSSEIGKFLKKLRNAKDGLPCVKLVSDELGREHVYQITDEGKRQLNIWLRIHVAPDAYHELVRKIVGELDSSTIAGFVADLKLKVKELLGS